MGKLKRLFGMTLMVIIFAFRMNPGNEEKIQRSSKSFHLTNPEDSAKTIFLTSCYSCHKDSAASLAPSHSVLSLMTPRAIVASLTNGKIRQQGANLSKKKRMAVAEWITKSKLKPTTFPKEAYTTFSLTGNTHPFDHSGWGNDKEGTGFRTAQQAGISPANVASLKLKWAFAFPDATMVRNKPAIVGDWIITGSQFGDVFALNKNTG
jgi:polyvinyl alcohol dehydrogenase (cytochrome)